MCECSTIARSPTALSLGTTDRQEVERAVEVALGAHPEVRRSDPRNEPLVERPRDPQRGVDSVPAGPERQLVDSQLSSVEDAEDLDPREVGVEQLAILARRVFAQMPRVLGLLGARGREGQA